MQLAGRGMTFADRFEAMDDPKAKFVSSVYSGLTACLALATVAAYFGAEWYAANYPSSHNTWRILRFAPCAMLLIGMFVRVSGVFGWGFLLAFVALDGFVIGPIIHAVTQRPGGTTTVLMALGLTTTIFATLTAYVRVTGKDFRWLGGILFIASIAMVLAGIAVMFFGVSADIRLLLSVVSAVLFSGWILYDTSAVTREYYQENNVPGAILSLFVDFVGLFMALLNILNSRDD